MEITLDEALKGKATIIKGKEYLSAEAYLTPFLERMSKYTNDFRVQVKTPNQMSLTEKTEDIIYNRIWIQAVMPNKYCFDNNHQESINLLYALDTRKPVVKIFKNYLNMACLNMCVFNPHAISIQNLEPDSPINYKFVDNVLSMTDNTISILNKLSDQILTENQIFDTLGKWIDKCINFEYNNGFGKVKLSKTLPVDVYEMLFIDSKSPYYCNTRESDYFNIYNTFTYLISNDKGKDIVNKFEKSYLAAQVLDIV